MPSPTDPREIGEAYRERLARFMNPADPTPAPSSSGLEISAQSEGIVLTARIDAGEHRLTELRSRGGTPSQRALLAALRHVSIGSTIQDASEHAVIRLENLLRDPAHTRPVKGILQPENADPAFRLPLALLRGIYRAYLLKTGYTPVPNYEDALPCASWSAATHAERLQRILAAIPEICPQTGLRKADIEIKGIDLETKVTVALPAGIDPAIQQMYLTRLETEVKSKVEPRLELYLEDVRDRNTKRHAQLPGRQEGV